ncbi:hypothetical protein D3C85_1477120 [compost metagenome]
MLAGHLHHEEMRTVVHVDLVRTGSVVDAPFTGHQQGAAPGLADFAAARQLQRHLVARRHRLLGLQLAAAHALRAAAQFADLHPSQRVHRHAVAKAGGKHGGHF